MTRFSMLALLPFVALAACATEGVETHFEEAPVANRVAGAAPRVPPASYESPGGAYYNTGNMKIGPDGTTYVNTGRFSIGPDGRMFTQIGNLTMGPDGNICQRIGSFDYC